MPSHAPRIFERNPITLTCFEEIDVADQAILDLVSYEGFVWEDNQQ